MRPNPEEIRRPLPGVNDRPLMLAPGEGTVTKASRVGRGVKTARRAVPVPGASD